MVCYNGKLQKGTKAFTPAVTINMHIVVQVPLFYMNQLLLFTNTNLPRRISHVFLLITVHPKKFSELQISQRICT